MALLQDCLTWLLALACHGLMYDDALLQVWIAGCVVFVLMTESAMEGSWFVLDLKVCIVVDIVE